MSAPNADRWVHDGFTGRVMSEANRIFGQGAWSSDENLRADVRRAAIRVADQFWTLTERRGGKHKPIRRAMYHLLRSLDARLCCLILSWPKGKAAITLPAARQIASEINPRKPSGEPVHTWLANKAGGGSRRLWSFGPRTRAMQCLAVHALMALWGPAKFEFARAGRGRDAALLQVIENAKKKGGARWYLTADIKDCFGSFNREVLLKIIPLPRAVIENSLFVMSGTKIVSHKSDTLDTSKTAVLSGLPQGSLASPYIASKLLEPVLEKLNGAPLLAHVDDILVGARTEIEAKANEQSLGELLAAHPAGPLLMKSNVAKLGRPIDFCSYRIRLRWLRYGGGVRLTPSPKAFDRLEHRAYDRLVGVNSSDRQQVATRYMRNWIASFRLWDIPDEGLDRLRLETFAHVLSAVSAKKACSGINSFT